MNRRGHHRPPQVALIGISGYGRIYLKSIEAAHARGELNFCAATVIDRAAEAEACARLTALGVTLHDTWQAMLQEWKGRLDLCLIPAPIHLHEMLTIAALEAGANVLVEKPLAVTVEQVHAIQAAERRTGKWVAVGYQDYYCPSVRAIREDLAAGRIGLLQSIQWIGLWPRGHSYYSRNDWAGRLKVRDLPLFDSPLNNAMAHFLNLALYWSGATPAVAAQPLEIQSELFRCHPIESFDTAVVRIQTDTDVTIHVAATHCCPTQHPIQMRLRGSDGELNWTHRQGLVWSDAKGGSHAQVLETYDQIQKAQFATILNRLRDPQANICTTNLALPHVACIETLHKTGSIQDISRAYLQKGFGKDGAIIIINNIEEDFKKCLDHFALPSELELPWASPFSQDCERVQSHSSPSCSIPGVG